MNQKDYEKIAKIIKTQEVFKHKYLSVINKKSLICRLADYFEQENINNEIKQIGKDKIQLGQFDKQQFIKACDVEDITSSKDYSNKYECNKCGGMVNNEEECDCGVEE